MVDGEAGKSFSQERRAAEKVLIMYLNDFIYKTCFLLYLHKVNTRNSAAYENAHVILFFVAFFAVCG